MPATGQISFVPKTPEVFIIWRLFHHLDVYGSSKFFFFFFFWLESVAGSQSEQEMGRAVLPSLQSRLAHSLPRYRGPFQALRVTCCNGQSFTELEYLLLALVSAVPSFVIPMLVVGKVSWIQLPNCLKDFDSSLCWKDRYWVKASTSVPHTTFLLTHVCFLFYHVTSNITLRRLQHFAADFPERVQWIIRGAWILALSYFIAYLETLAISNSAARCSPDLAESGNLNLCKNLGLGLYYDSSPQCAHDLMLMLHKVIYLANNHATGYRKKTVVFNVLFLNVQFPYYEFVDRASMYTVGSLFYAIYFFVSFPMFLR
ncbi:hypothetical protein C3L33_00546, partial [Rhododendron williamsianum]